MSYVLPSLLPCPFCDSAKMMVDETLTHPTMDGKQSLIGVYVRHWCVVAGAKPAQRQRIEAHGRDHADAAELWNRRVNEVERLREENSILRASLKIDFEAALKRAEGDR